MKNRNLKKRRGQTIVEYVLIICIVVVASIGILSIFSDTVRHKIAGIANTFGTPDSLDTDAELNKESKDIMKDLDKEGLE